MAASIGVELDRLERLEGKGRPAVRFNASVTISEDGTPVAGFWFLGFRVRDGLIHLPAFTGRGRSHPSFFVSQRVAEAIVDKVIENVDTIYELLSDGVALQARHALVAALMPGTKELLGSFPRALAGSK